MLTLLAFVALGVLSDFLIGKYYLALSARLPFRASAYALVIPLLTFGVLAQALETKSVTSIVAFCAGNSIGTYWVIRRAK